MKAKKICKVGRLVMGLLTIVCALTALAFSSYSLISDVMKPFAYDARFDGLDGELLWIVDPAQATEVSTASKNGKYTDTLTTEQEAQPHRDPREEAVRWKPAGYRRIAVVARVESGHLTQEFRRARSVLLPSWFVSQRAGSIFPIVKGRTSFPINITTKTVVTNGDQNLTTTMMMIDYAHLSRMLKAPSPLDPTLVEEHDGNSSMKSRDDRVIADLFLIVHGDDISEFPQDNCGHYTETASLDTMTPRCFLVEKSVFEKRWELIFVRKSTNGCSSAAREQPDCYSHVLFMPDPSAFILPGFSQQILQAFEQTLASQEAAAKSVPGENDGHGNGNNKLLIQANGNVFFGGPLAIKSALSMTAHNQVHQPAIGVRIIAISDTSSASFVAGCSEHDSQPSFSALVFCNGRAADTDADIFSLKHWEDRVETSRDIQLPVGYLPWGPNGPSNIKALQPIPDSLRGLHELPVGRSSAAAFAKLIAYHGPAREWLDVPLTPRERTIIDPAYCQQFSWKERLAKRDPAALKPSWLSTVPPEHHTELVDENFDKYYSIFGDAADADQDASVIRDDVCMRSAAAVSDPEYRCKNNDTIAVAVYVDNKETLKNEIKGMLYPSWHYMTRVLMTDQSNEIRSAHPSLPPTHFEPLSNTDEVYKIGYDPRDFKRIDLLIFVHPALTAELLQSLPLCHAALEETTTVDSVLKDHPRAHLGYREARLARLVQRLSVENRGTGNRAGVCMLLPVQGHTASIFESNPYMKSLIMVTLPSYRHLLVQYYRLLRTDGDVFLFPGLRRWRPQLNSVTGRGGYGHTNYTWYRLEEVSKEMNLRHLGMHEVGSTWYAVPEIIMRAMPIALAAAERFLKVIHPRNRHRWSYWYHSVTSMYATELAVNHIVDNCDNFVERNYFDAASWWEKDDPNIAHIHCWPKPLPFEKHFFHNRRYRRVDYPLEKLRRSFPRDYAFWMTLYYACDVTMSLPASLCTLR